MLIHKYCGILSAYGLGLADVVQEKEEPTNDQISQSFIDGTFALSHMKIKFRCIR